MDKMAWKRLGRLGAGVVIVSGALGAAGCGGADAPRTEFNSISAWVDTTEWVLGSGDLAKIPEDVKDSLKSTGPDGCVAGGKPATATSQYRIYCDSFHRAYLIDGDMVGGSEIRSVDITSTDPPLVTVTFTEAGMKAIRTPHRFVGIRQAVIKDGWVCESPIFQDANDEANTITFTGGKAVEACLRR